MGRTEVELVLKKLGIIPAVSPLTESRLYCWLEDNPTDDEISLMEDFTDTFASLSANNSDDISAKLTEAESKNAEWEQKYNDNDAMWRKKYMDRFNGKVEDIPEVKKSLEADRSENITINDLFTPKA